MAQLGLNIRFLFRYVVLRCVILNGLQAVKDLARTA
jgi:hypothetical protein